MRVNAIGFTSTTTTSTSEVTATSRIEGMQNNGIPSSIPYNDSVMEMDLMTDIMWDFYEKFNGDTNYLLIILYVPVMALAVTANILVITVVFKYHYLRSVTNYFVVNLSVADLLVTIICMPVAVSQAVSMAWSHGELMCKLSSYLQGVAVAASVFTITAMSIDRYLAIRSPMAFRRVFNRKSTVLVIVALWLVALTIFAPVLRGMTLHNPSTEFSNITFHGSWIGNFSHDISRLPPVFYICLEDLRPLGIRAHIFGTAYFVLVYAIPGFVVILSYSMMGRTLCSRKPPFDCDSVEGSASSQQSFRLVRERRRIAWILLLLAVLFALCWLPYNVLRLLVDFGVVEWRSITDALPYCLFLGHANSALNPVVYCFMTRNFRRSVSEILRRTSHSLARRKPRRKSAIIDDGCGGCSVPAVNGGARRNLSHQRRMLPGCGCGIPMRGNRNAILALRRTATSSSGYDTFYSRHSPHLHCYMLRSIRDVPQAQANNPPENSDARRNQARQEYHKNNGLDSSQPQPSTLCTTDGRRPFP
ncbi:QRFP-like peptide receptor isoform X2 [Formica exsecta]|uniref:QRFP-like peptide receptor isoform X2 n=1 Tax=Formica exsecta TaxID=72781 RepID=UPI001142EAF5|nr:QRFP-like peptide receptor isoform X2 [Formica exsecta]